MTKVIPLLVGPVVLVGWLFLVDVGLPPEAHRLAGILLMTLIWWVAEPMPIAATGLLGVALCVILDALPPAERGRDGLRLVFAPFADPSVFFLMGGMFIGRAMTRHGLDRRIALALLCTRWAGRTPGTVLTTVALSVTLISMWISNAAAAAMMCPVAVGIVAVLAAARRPPDNSNTPDDFARSPYATALMLAVAFGASVGGIAEEIPAILIPAALFLLPGDRAERQVTRAGVVEESSDWDTLRLCAAALALGGLMFRTCLAEAVRRAAFARLGTRDPRVLTAV